MKQNDVSWDEPIVRPRMPELDVLRGIAILAVVAFHGFGNTLWDPVSRPAWQRMILLGASEGWAGVNLFFVLSGFLITGILVDSVPKPRYFARFYTHRALRILPIYYPMLLVLFATYCLAGYPLRIKVEFIGLSFIYLSNLTPLFGFPTLYPLLWSLSVEEHFYLLWPAMVRLLARRGLAILALVICVVEPALRWYALGSVSDLWWAGQHYIGSYQYTWMSADGLALGALLALLARSSWGSRENFLKLALIALVASVGLTALSFFVPPALALCIRGTVVNYYALAMIAGTLWLGSGAHRQWANIRLLSLYGYISYGLYLVHGWIIGMYEVVVSRVAPGLLPRMSFGKVCLKTAICLAVATTIAYISRVTYEEYFLRMKDRPAKPRSVERAAAVA